MKKETKDKKSTKPSWIEKTTTMAAIVAALGISLGVDVQKVYAKDGEDGVNRVVQEQGKIESQQGKFWSQQHKINAKQIKGETKINATQNKGETNLETK